MFSAMLSAKVCHAFKQTTEIATTYESAVHTKPVVAPL